MPLAKSILITSVVAVLCILSCQVATATTCTLPTTTDFKTHRVIQWRSPNGIGPSGVYAQVYQADPLVTAEPTFVFNPSPCSPGWVDCANSDLAIIMLRTPDSTVAWVDHDVAEIGWKKAVSGDGSSTEYFTMTGWTDTACPSGQQPPCWHENLWANDPVGATTTYSISYAYDASTQAYYFYYDKNGSQVDQQGADFSPTQANMRDEDHTMRSQMAGTDTYNESWASAQIRDSSFNWWYFGDSHWGTGGIQEMTEPTGTQGNLDWQTWPAGGGHNGALGQYDSNITLPSAFYAADHRCTP